MATFQTFQKEEQRRKKAALKREARLARRGHERKQNQQQQNQDRIETDQEPRDLTRTVNPAGRFQGPLSVAAPQIKVR